MRRTLLIASLGVSLFAQKFYADDPLLNEPIPRNVKEAKPRKLSDYYDLFSNQFGEPGQQSKPGKSYPSLAVNTLGEPMNSQWWERRHYYQPMTLEQLKAGPLRGKPPAAGKWKIVSAKAEGVTPGFAVLDPTGVRYFIKFDPFDYPEIATGADIIGSRMFHAFGYFVPDNFLVAIDPKDLVIGDEVDLFDPVKFTTRPMTNSDLELILRKTYKTADGRIRAIASAALPGKPLGPFRYYGQRTDDVNDTVPHEHRRDLRGLHVFFAFLNHDDSRAINTLDTLVEQDGRKYVRHHLIDFGSTMGSSSTGINSPRGGHEYLFGWKTAARQFFTFGLAPPYWSFARYPKFRSVGRFESKIFDPEKWRPEYRNIALHNRLAEDEFWAAKQVMALTDEQIRAIVSEAKYSDASAADWVAKCLIERRDKIGKAYLNKVLPLDNLRVQDGRLQWDDVSAKHKLGGAGALTINWFRFDNATSRMDPLNSSGESLPAGAEWLAAKLSNGKHDMTVYVRGGKVVGVERSEPAPKK
jgi:hypothetical protein